MFKQPLIELAKHIYSFNSYFNNYYPCAYMDQATGYIYAPSVNPGGDLIPLFPNDTLGNYFYFRLPNEIKLDSSTQFRIAEGITGVGIVHDIVLVACIREGDGDTLIGNIVATLQHYPKGTISFNKAVCISESVIFQELYRLDVDQIKKALANLGTNTIVSVHFSYTHPLPLIDPVCLDNPCTKCN